MTIFLKNASDIAIQLEDFFGLTINAGATVDITGFDQRVAKASNGLISSLQDGELYIGSDASTLKTKADGVSYLMSGDTQYTRDGKPIITASDRPINTYRHYSGCGDDIVNKKRGAGTPLNFDVAPGQTQSIEAHFIDSIYIRDGVMFFQSATLGSYLTVEIVAPKGTPYPVANNGNMDLVNGQWTPNSSNTGAYRVDTTQDVVFDRFLNQYGIIGTRSADMDSPEPMLMVTPYYLRVSVFNADSSNNLQACVTIGMYRQLTV